MQTRRVKKIKIKTRKSFYKNLNERQIKLWMSWQSWCEIYVRKKKHWNMWKILNIWKR